MVILTIMLMELLSGTEFDIFVPSFTQIQQQFNISEFWLVALLSSNFIGYLISLVFAGALSDKYGRKPIIIIGLSIFIIGSILCFWGASYNMLLIGRFIQGIGIAGPAILGFLIIADKYDLKKQQYYMAILNGLINVSIGIAPVAGSYITYYFNWHGNFAALLILGCLCLLMVITFLPNVKLPYNPEYERETVSLKNYIPIFKSKNLILLITHIVFMFLPYWIFVGISPILYIRDLGISLKYFGYYQGVFALIFAFGSILFGLMINRCDTKKMLHITNYVFVLSLACTIFISFYKPATALLITLSFIPFTIAQIVPCAVVYPMALNYMPKLKGKASAVIQGSRLILSAISLQIAAHYYNKTIQNPGLMISLCIVIVIITLYKILKNPEFDKYFYV